jgi:hypothetical protein
MMMEVVLFSYSINDYGSYYLQIQFISLDNADNPYYSGEVRRGSGTLFILKPIMPDRNIQCN